MPIKFKPQYIITPKIATLLMRIEATKEKIISLPLTVKALQSLRETAQLYTAHYSTMIEGNRLTFEQVAKVLKNHKHFPGKDRDEHEIKGYYAALHYCDAIIAKKTSITEKTIQTIHALVMSAGKTNVKPTPYRDGQNATYDGKTRNLVYLPPESKDVSILMNALVNWINSNKHIIPSPIIASIAHYQFATIHPYYDGNGRTARLLTTLILHLGGYDAKGIYSLEEYYARNLANYYHAISVGPSHNYYEGRAESNITQWIEYFIVGMTVAYDNVLKNIQNNSHTNIIQEDSLIQDLDQKKRKALMLFQQKKIITAKDIGEIFNFKERTSSQLCKQWVEEGFLEIVDFSNKGRKYKIAQKYEALC